VFGYGFAKFVDETASVTKSAHQAIGRALAKAAYAIFRTAQASIVISPQPSKAGQPPHSRAGQLKRAERYEVDRDDESAVIGPRASLVGTSAEPEEFGGEYRGGMYPTRRFMGPALAANAHLLPSGLQSEVTNQ
jgi:hypothetical protein